MIIRYDRFGIEFKLSLRTATQKFEAKKRMIEKMPYLRNLTDNEVRAINLFQSGTSESDPAYQNLATAIDIYDSTLVNLANRPGGGTSWKDTTTGLSVMYDIRLMDWLLKIRAGFLLRCTSEKDYTTLSSSSSEALLEMMHARLPFGLNLQYYDSKDTKDLLKDEKTYWRSTKN